MTFLAVADLPSSETLREKAEEVVSRAYYELEAGEPPEDPSRLLDLIRAILKPFEWLYDRMEGVPDSIRWVIIIFLAALLLLLIAHIVYTLVGAIRGPAAKRRRAYTPSSRDVDPADLEIQAEKAGQGGDFIGGVRLLFRAALRRIEIAEKKRLRPGFTNRELLRRYATSPLREPLKRFVDVIELKWYGNEPCEQGDFLACRSENVRIREYADEAARLAS
jgi:hypothetical protein